LRTRAVTACSGAALRVGLEGGLAVADRLDQVARVAEVVRGDFAQRVVVFHEQDSVHVGAPRRQPITTAAIAAAVSRLPCAGRVGA
jgi:hypothetical protein